MRPDDANLSLAVRRLLPSRTPDRLGTGSVPWIGLTAAGQAWAVPAAETRLLVVASLVQPADLTRYQEWRLVGYLSATAVVAGTKIRGKYATTAGGALTDLGTGGDVLVDAAGVLSGAWTPIPFAARAETFLCVVGLDGNGLALATFSVLGMEFR